jgi:hypothetical protein
MEQLIVILIFAAIAIINKALRKGDMTDSGNIDKGSPPLTPSAPVRRLKADQTEEERVRKFMEALGVPPGSVVPPKKIVRPQQQPVRRVSPQVRIETPQPAAARAAVPPPQPTAPPATYAEASSMPSGKSVVSAESTAAIPTALQPAQAVDLQAMLKTPASIRTAFILREILGPPRSLQSFSDAPSFP